MSDPRHAAKPEYSVHAAVFNWAAVALHCSCLTAVSDVVQVVKASDVLFLFGGLADVRDTIKSIKDDLKDKQIIVPVTKDGNLDVFQVCQLRHCDNTTGFGSSCVAFVHLSAVT